MRKIVFILLLLAGFSSCTTEDNFIDTGKANGKFNGTMLAYLKSDKYNWDLTVEMIARAGLNDLFDGKDAAHPAITFIGPTKFSILRYMLQNNYATVAAVPVATCKDLLLRHVIDGKKKAAEIATGSPIPRKGGVLLPTVQGTKLFLYTFKGPVGGVAGAGPLELFVESENANFRFDIASTDIEPTNGVVHSLHYDYTLGDF